MSREMKDSGVEWIGRNSQRMECKKGKALYRTGKLDANAEEPTGIYPFLHVLCFRKINQYAFDCEALICSR